jgi:hypothetical protein
MEFSFLVLARRRSLHRLSDRRSPKKIAKDKNKERSEGMSFGLAQFPSVSPYRLRDIEQVEPLGLLGKMFKEMLYIGPV